MGKGHGSKGYILGNPTSGNLSKWANHGQLGTETGYPTRENSDPDAVTYRAADGSLSHKGQTYSRCDESGHKYPSMKGGQGGGASRISLSKTQRNRRGG
jgi:hypothetical protein